VSPSGRPKALVPRLCRLVVLRVSPGLPPSDICCFRSSGLPQIGFLSGSMMNPRFARTLHPRSIQLTSLQVAPKFHLPAAPRMNLQTQSSLAFLPTLRCFLNLYPLFACRRTGLLRTTINQFLIACRAGLQSVAFFTGLLCRLCRLLPLPFRSFHSLRITASTGFATVRSTFRNCPIFVRSPQPFH